MSMNEVNIFKIIYPLPLVLSFQAVKKKLDIHLRKMIKLNKPTAPPFTFTIIFKTEIFLNEIFNGVRQQ